MVNYHAWLVAHGVLGALAWVIFFPLGSVLIRVMSGPATWKVHAVVQLFSMAMFTAAVGTGLQIAVKIKLLHHYHAIIGLVIFVLMFIQAVAGFFHHILFKKHQRRTLMSHIHLWLGRALITLGMINGGLGLKLNRRVSRGQIIAYGVVTGVIWVGWLVTSAFCRIRKGDSNSGSRKERRALTQQQRIQEEEAKKIVAYKESVMAGSTSNESVNQGR